MEKIKVAIVGVGNCASSLVQGVQFYTDNPDNELGIMFKDIGGYTAKDIEFVVAFDIDERKVDKTLSEAIYAKPNCTMEIVPPETKWTNGANTCKVYYGKLLDGVAPHMLEYPEEITFKPAKDKKSIDEDRLISLLKEYEVDVLLNYVPVGANLAAEFYLVNALRAGVSVVNCMPTFISTEDSQVLERIAIENKATIVGSDMRSAVGASRTSEVLHSMFLDAGTKLVQHIQENKACGITQGDTWQGGTSANTDFLNMAERDRLHNKHISKENVLAGQSTIRNKPIAGNTYYAGPSLTVLQKPGGEYHGSDTKVANFDLAAIGWGGARYRLTAVLDVQDSPNSGGIVFDALRYCKVAREMGIVGYLRGPSAYTQKTPPLQMTTERAKEECRALARREFTQFTENQTEEIANKFNSIDEFMEKNCLFTTQLSKTDYE